MLYKNYLVFFFFFWFFPTTTNLDNHFVKRDWSKADQ